MERFIKEELLKRVSAQDWVNPQEMLPWSAQNGHSFIVFYRSRYSYNINEEDKEYLEEMGLDENGWEYDTEMVRWDERIPQDERMTPPHNGKNYLTYHFIWNWDVWEGEEEFEILAWKEIPVFTNPKGETINISNPCDERYNCDKEYIQKTFFDQFKL